MNRKLTLPQYLLLLLLLPPIGAFLICTADHIRPCFKIFAVLYCFAVLLLLMTIRLPKGAIYIDATALN